MVLDTSVVVAILLREAVAEQLKTVILRSDSELIIGAPSVHEALMVLSTRFPDDAEAEVLSVLRHLTIRIVPFTAQHAVVAHAAFLRYGKGRHPAKLNYGDCMSYAVAKAANLPLLFVGNDFSLTDVNASM